MKQAFLGSLISCIVVGQIFGAAYNSQERKMRHIPSLQQLCTNALVTTGVGAMPATPSTFIDGIRAVRGLGQIYNNAANLPAILPAHMLNNRVDQEGMHIGNRVYEAVRPWERAHERFHNDLSSISYVGGLGLGVFAGIGALQFVSHKEIIKYTGFETTVRICSGFLFGAATCRFFALVNQPGFVTKFKKAEAGALTGILASSGFGLCCSGILCDYFKRELR